MKKIPALNTAYWILLAINILAGLGSFDFLVASAKVLMMPILFLVLIISLTGSKSKVFIWAVFALLFSWFGDILLVFEETGNYFLFGMTSFLIAHLAYIIVFRMTRNITDKKLSATKWVLVGVVLLIYLMFLFSKIGEGLGQYRIPVIIYAIAISGMFLASFSRLYRTSSPSFVLTFAGAGIFILSDSLIALNKFLAPVSFSEVWIMLSYGVAQYLIIHGLLQHVRLREH